MKSIIQSHKQLVAELELNYLNVSLGDSVFLQIACVIVALWADTCTPLEQCSGMGWSAILPDGIEKSEDCN